MDTNPQTQSQDETRGRRTSRSASRGQPNTDPDKFKQLDQNFRDRNWNRRDSIRNSSVATQIRQGVQSRSTLVAPRKPAHKSSIPILDTIHSESVMPSEEDVVNLIEDDNTIYSLPSTADDVPEHATQPTQSQYASVLEEMEKDRRTQNTAQSHTLRRPQIDTKDNRSVSIDLNT